MENEASKNMELTKRIAELERLAAQKQMEIDYYKVLIALASEEYGVDLKEQCEPLLKNNSKSKSKNTDTKWQTHALWD